MNEQAAKNLFLIYTLRRTTTQKDNFVFASAYLMACVVCVLLKSRGRDRGILSRCDPELLSVVRGLNNGPRQ